MSGRLTDGFRDIIELQWTDFVAMEQSLDGTNFDAIVAALVRACAKGNLRAIQTALDRLDGKIATEVEVEYPQFYTIYPRATMAADDPGIIEIPQDDHLRQEPKMIQSGASDLDELDAQDEELPTGSLRVVLEKMLDAPKDVVTQILGAIRLIDAGEESYGNPRVKNVIVAGLMKLVHDGRISAVFEVMDQIDGKVADKVKLLGDDFRQIRYDTIAPAGAVKNADGIYQISNDNTTNIWAARLGAGKKNR